MEKTSSAELHLHMPLNTVLVARKYDRRTANAVLVLPDFGETIMHGKYDALCERLPYTTYLLELRGHGHSEGQWSASLQMQDIDALLAALQQKFRQVFVVAHGLLACMVLEREHAQHMHHPAGILLIAPHEHTLRFFNDMGACRKHARLRQELAAVKVRPVRVQTPMVIFADPAHPLLRSVFGPVRVKRIQQSQVHFLEDVQSALRDLLIADVPIRFAKSRLLAR